MSHTHHLGPEPLDYTAALARCGVPGFRPGQREAVETLLRAGRLLFVAPTGGGKSLIFQLPAVLLPGTTIVVSPLVSLMKDQVASLERKGIPATYLAATLDPAEQARRSRGLRSGAYRLLYVAPERLASPRFRALVGELTVPLLAVDEAHCISEWGHDFRPEYLRIGEFLAVCGPPRVLAVTATATPLVQDEIVSRLGLGSDAPRLVRGFARPNLALRVERVGDRAERERRVDRILDQHLPGDRPGGAAVVYAPTRRMAEEEAVRLARTSGRRCLAYHAGLPAEVRDAAQEAFCSGAVDVVVATNAFGMGIDRSDVRLVIHLAPPGSLESYYQEVGRGGRDGGDAVGVLLLGRDGIALRRRFVERAPEEDETGAEESEAEEGGRGGGPDARERRRQLFHELMRWSLGRRCRHEAILRYFGEEGSGLRPCGRCDICAPAVTAPGRSWRARLRAALRRPANSPSSREPSVRQS